MKTTILMAFLAVILANCGSNTTNPNLTTLREHEGKLGNEKYVIVAGDKGCTKKENEIAGSCTGRFVKEDKANKSSRYKLAFSLDGKDSSFTLLSKSNISDSGEVKAPKVMIKFFMKEGQENPEVEVTCSKVKTATLAGLKAIPATIEVEVGPHGTHNHVHILYDGKDVEVGCGGELMRENWGFILDKAKLTSATIGEGTLPLDH